MNLVRFILTLILTIFAFAACTENYANGERVGMVTRFTKKGLMFDTWEGSLNLTQTGMNTSGVPFDFSVDRDREDPKLVAMIDSAANHGWKVKLNYHETFGKNWFNNRGETNHFVTSVDVLDRNPVGFLRGVQDTTRSASSGQTIDTVYVVIVGRASEGYKLVPK